MTLIDASTPCCNCNDRLQWRQELQRERERHGSNTNRHAHTQTLPPLDAAPAPPPHPGGLPIQAEGKAGPSSSTASDPASQHRQSDRDREASPSASSSVKPADGPSDENGAGAGAGDGDLTPTSSATAVELYAAAVTFEREGRLNEALRAYRSAFRKNDTVDKLYHKQQVRAEAAAAAAAAATGSGAAATTIAGSQNSTEPATDSLAFSFQRTLQLEPDYERQKGQLKAKMLTASYVDKLLASFAENPYIPKAERKSQQEPQSPAGQQDDIGEQATPEDGTDATTTAAGTDTALGKAKAKDAARHTLVFHPRNDSKPLHIAKLPDELLVHILSFLTALSPHARSPDMRSLERGFSLVSRKARILTLDSAAALWKPACLAVYTAPLLLDPATTASRVAAQAYGADWRLMWIEQPRVRTDGVYISQTTYVRRGAPDSIGTSFAYNDITHMVTYYRYLCFLPTGDVVSLLSHDIPAVVVPNLLASHRHRAAAASASSSSPSPGRHRHGQAAVPAPSAGLSVGKWRTRHLPPTSTSPAPSMLVELTSLEDPRITSPSELKHSFTMTCRCKSTARGKNNKLEMLSLVALNHRTGEEGEIPIKSGTAGNQMPSFYFSRVLSYD